MEHAVVGYENRHRLDRRRRERRQRILARGAFVGLEPGSGPGEAPAAGGVAREQSVCAHVVAAKEALVVPDVQRDPRFAANPALIENGIRFYAGAPLRDAEGHVLGTLCLLDTQPRTMSLRDAKLLESLADEVMVPLRDRSRTAAGG